MWHNEVRNKRGGIIAEPVTEQGAFMADPDVSQTALPGSTDNVIGELLAYHPAIARRHIEAAANPHLNGQGPGTFAQDLAQRSVDSEEAFLAEYTWLAGLAAYSFEQSSSWDRKAVMLAAEDGLFRAIETYDQTAESDFIRHAAATIDRYLEEIFEQSAPSSPYFSAEIREAFIPLADSVNSALQPDQDAQPSEPVPTQSSEATLPEELTVEPVVLPSELPDRPTPAIETDQLARSLESVPAGGALKLALERRVDDLVDGEDVLAFVPTETWHTRTLMRGQIISRKAYDRSPVLGNDSTGLLVIGLPKAPYRYIVDVDHNGVIPLAACEQMQADSSYLERWLENGSPESLRLRPTLEPQLIDYLRSEMSPRVTAPPRLHSSRRTTAKAKSIHDKHRAA